MLTETGWCNETLIYLGVADEDEIPEEPGAQDGRGHGAHQGAGDDPLAPRPCARHQEHHGADREEDRRPGIADRDAGAGEDPGEQRCPPVPGAQPAFSGDEREAPLMWNEMVPLTASAWAISHSS